MAGWASKGSGFLLALLLIGGSWAEPSSLFLKVGEWVKTPQAGTQLRLLKIEGSQARLEISEGGKSRNELHSAGSWLVLGDHVLRLQSLDAKRKIPLLIQPRLAPPARQAVPFLLGYGWHAQSDFQSLSDRVPARLTGLPWFHYQAASDQLGMDLGLASGHDIEVRRYRLQEKTPEGFVIYAYLAVYRQRIVGAWLAPDGDRAPGIYPLNRKKL